MNDRRVLPSGPTNARIYIVGEAPGQEETIAGEPFVGKSGWLLNQMLSEAGIARSDCRVGNVFQVQPLGNKIERFIENGRKTGEQLGYVPYNNRWVHPDRFGDIGQLFADIRRVEPHLLILMGGTATWALAGDKNVDRRRGNLVEVEVEGQKFKAISTYHPAYILRSWSDRYIGVHDLKRAERESYTPALRERPESFVVRPTFGQVMDFLNRLFTKLTSGPTTFTADLETRGHQIACLGLGLDRVEAICVPFMCVERRSGYWSEPEELAIIELLRRLFTHPNTRVVGQNFLYDSQYIFSEWLCLPRVYADTMFMQHTLFPSLRKRLDFLVTLYADQPRYWKVDGKEWDPKVPEEQLWTYNCRDCSYTFEVFEEMLALLEKQKMMPQWQFLQSLFNPVLDMMLRGVKRNDAQQAAFSAELESALKERREWLTRVCGHPINENSTKQVPAFFYDDLRIKPVLAKRANGSFSPTCDDEALQKVAIREPIIRPVVETILDARRVGKFKSTFVDMEPSSDGRIRCSFNITGTKTYRFSSSENAFGSGTNLQNVPRATSEVAEYVRDSGPIARKQLATLFESKDIDAAESEGYIAVDDEGVCAYRFVLPAVRRMFSPDDGYTLVDMDLDRADAQVVAWEADDAILKQMFREGVDIHSENARVLQCARQMAKTWVHGTNYGGGPRTMAMHCGITVHRAELMQRRWFAEHPGIKDWHERTMEALLTTRIVRNAFGFRCVFFDRPEGLLGEALAWVPQSTVALVINHALRNIYEKLPWAQLLLQVHDSLVMQVPTYTMPGALVSLEKLAKVTVPYDDPLVIPVSFKVSDKSWGDVKAPKKERKAA